MKCTGASKQRGKGSFSKKDDRARPEPAFVRRDEEYHGWKILRATRVPRIVATQRRFPCDLSDCCLRYNVADTVTRFKPQAISIYVSLYIYIYIYIYGRFWRAVEVDV